ncbi:MAG: CoA transferase [Thermodesulfobacteriota bacterium]
MRENEATMDLPGPLEGIKVVEYGVFHAGPGATAILGDLGAEVIKIEASPGDPVRHWTSIGAVTFALGNGESFMNEISNRNKKGISLNIKEEKGRRAFERLVSQADVFLTNLRKSTKDRMRLDYRSIAEINPRIIYAGVSGYGPEGALADVGAFDPLGLARSGMMFITGSDQPRLLHLGVLDQATAIAASHAIITALFTRERRGYGQEVHVSLYSTAIWLIYADLMMNNALSIDPTTSGERNKHSPLRNVFLCRDGKWLIGTHHPESKYWPSLCRATGRTDLIADPRFADDQARQANCRELVAIFDQVFAARTRDEWMEVLISHGLMYSPVQTIPEVQSDPQALVNGYITPFDHPLLGRFMVPGYPIHFSRNRAGHRGSAPDLGQHTHEILREIGYTDEEIEELEQAGAAPSA